MVLIQVLVPVTEALREGAEDIHAIFAAVRREVTELIDGVNARLRSVTDVGSGEAGEAPVSAVCIEVLASTFDRRWWRAYARKLARRFGQRMVRVRVESVGTPDAGGLRRGSLAHGDV